MADVFDEFRLATADDFDATWQLYADVCAQAPNDAYGPQWTLGVYPAKGDISGHIEAGEMYLGLMGGVPVAAMVLVPHEDPEYAAIDWPSGAKEDEVSAIHLLTVHPSIRGRHGGTELVRRAIELSRSMGKRAVHLDVIPGNLAASRIYLTAGFAFVGLREVFYEDTGLMSFEMYEYVL